MAVRFSATTVARPRFLCSGSSRVVRTPRAFASNGSNNDKQFRGPGGLTGQQLFDAVQRSKAIDKANAKASPPPPPPSQEEANGRFKRGSAAASQAQYLSTAELKSRLKEMKVPHNDCLDKESLVERYAEAAVKYTANLHSTKFD